MKKIILSVAAGFTIFNSYAQKMKEADVPATVKSAFAKQYAAVKVVNWEMEDGKYEAGFDLNKVKTSVLIDPKGNITETESKIAVSALPKTVTDYCVKNYADKKIAEASKIVDAKGVITYEAEINKKDVLFDSEGKFIKESQD